MYFEWNGTLEEAWMHIWSLMELKPEGAGTWVRFTIVRYELHPKLSCFSPRGHVFFIVLRLCNFSKLKIELWDFLEFTKLCFSIKHNHVFVKYI